MPSIPCGDLWHVLDGCTLHVLAAVQHAKASILDWPACGLPVPTGYLHVLPQHLLLLDINVMFFASSAQRSCIEGLACFPRIRE
jgi:hypothetical protein